MKLAIERACFWFTDEDDIAYRIGSLKRIDFDKLRDSTKPILFYG